ncbi:MAG TPA: hypothetical protein VJS92_14475 [Candidatus Polarisedimenticolaceae bacterium]|nr:hypothetical protein [Candidatus Polarisedimenticolaceae bacterium]
MEPRGKRLLLGCGLGCAGLAVVVIAVVVTFFVWLARPGELLDPGRLLGAESVGFAEWNLRLEDPGTARFAQAFLSRGRRVQRDTGSAVLPPGALEPLIQLGSAQDERKLSKLFPLRLAWTLRAGREAGADEQLVSLSAAGLGNRLRLMDWMLDWIFSRNRSGEVRVVEVAGEKLYEIRLRGGGQACFFIRGTDVLVTTDVDTARSAVERLTRPEPAPREATALDRLFAGIPDRPLRAALINPGGELSRTWRRLAGAPAPDAAATLLAELSGATLAGSLDGEDFTGQLELLAPDAGWAASHAEPLLRELRAGFHETHVQLEAPVVDGERIRVDFRVRELLGGIDELMRRAKDAAGTAVPR